MRTEEPLSEADLEAAERVAGKFARERHAAMHASFGRSHNSNRAGGNPNGAGVPRDATTPGAPFERAPLGSLMRQGIEPVRHVVTGLAYSRGLHWIYGDPKSGKSILARWTAAQVYRAAGRGPVVWIDHEMGAEQTGLALQDMGWNGDDADAMFWQVDLPDLSNLPLNALRAKLEATVQAAHAPMLVIDSVGKQLALLGLSENENAEVLQWTSRVLIPATKTPGIPVFVIDHMAKGASGQWARGASEKMAAADLTRNVASTGFSVEEQGTITYTATNDRMGRMPYKLFYELGGQGWADHAGGTAHPLRIAEVDAPPATKPGPKSTGSKSGPAILGMLEDAGDAGVTATEVAEALEVSANTARAALREVGAVQDGDGPAARWKRPGQGF